MPLNAPVIKWQAPTHEVDGSPIDYALDYALGVSDIPEDPQMLVVATFPGVLNPDGWYEQATDTLASFEEDGTYFVRLKALRRDRPELESAWSNEAEFEFDRPGAPRPPFLLDS